MQDDQIGVLKKQLIELVKSSENVHIDRADTINRLTRSLQESQRQCNELIEAGRILPNNFICTKLFQLLMILLYMFSNDSSGAKY